MVLYEVPLYMSLLGFMLALRAVFNMLVRNASTRGPMCFRGVHLSFKASLGYWDYQIQSPTIISTVPQNCPIFAFIITYIIMYHAI